MLPCEGKGLILHCWRQRGSNYRRRRMKTYGDASSAIITDNWTPSQTYSVSDTPVIRCHKPGSWDDRDDPLFLRLRRTRWNSWRALVCASCRQGVTQAGMQKAGCPFVPADWAEKYKPVLGPYKQQLGRTEKVVTVHKFPGGGSGRANGAPIDELSELPASLSRCTRIPLSGAAPHSKKLVLLGCGSPLHSPSRHRPSSRDVDL